MDSYDLLPDGKISDMGEISRVFLEKGINSFKDACMHVHNLDYGYNSNYEDNLILFKEMKGSCTSKHGVIATLAEELGIPLYKNVGVYRFTEQITTSTQKILETYNIPYVPMIHCFLVYKNYKFDLTEGNHNGKKKPIDNFISIEKVIPFITRKDEYNVYKKIVKEFVIDSEEMKGVSMRSILKARADAIKLLHGAIES